MFDIVNNNNNNILLIIIIIIIIISIFKVMIKLNTKLVHKTLLFVGQGTPLFHY